MLKAVYDPETATPEMKLLVHALGVAGGKVGMSSYDHAADEGYINILKKGAIGQALRQASLKYPSSPIRQAFNIAGRALETTMAPTMEYLVPRQKLGVFSRMAQDWLERNPPPGDHLTNPMYEATFATKMQDIWDSVDNRLGEMNYDNLFWHKLTKDAAFAAVRSVGWNMGTFREIGGGLFDATKQTLRAATGRDAEWTHRMSYLIALPLMTGIYGGMYQYLSTGEGPQELKDLFFPRTGYLLKDGAKERVVIPSYMRDAYAMALQPGQTLINKLNPAISMFAQMLDGKDYYGDIIANYEDPVVKQAEDILTWAAKSMLPFSITGGNKMANHPALQQAAGYMGIQPAPAYVADPESNERWEERQHRIDVGKKNKRGASLANPYKLRRDPDLNTDEE